MSLSKEQMIELMQYADGELSSDECEAVKTLLASNEEARTFISEMSKLGAWVEQAEGVVVSGASSASTFDIADSVMARLEANAEERAAETVPRKTDPLESVPRAVVSQITSLDVVREKRRRIGVFVVTALAAAAGIAFLMRHPAEEVHHEVAIGTAHQVDTAPLPSAHASLSPASSEASQTLANVGDKAGEPGVEVNVATDSSQTGVSVFYIPGTSSTAASAVVWIEDTGDKN